MRTQRNFMVQTDEQYIFIFDVLVEAIQHGDTEIASCDLAAAYKSLTELRTNGREPLLEIQFNSLNAASNYYDQTVFSNAHLPDNESKNRCRTIVPFDHNRVTLQAIYRQDHSEYINASHIDGFYKKNAFIATQAPLENTTADFWRMVMEQNASTIVMLASDEEQGKVSFLGFSLFLLFFVCIVRNMACLYYSSLVCFVFWTQFILYSTMIIHPGNFWKCSTLFIFDIPTILSLKFPSIPTTECNGTFFFSGKKKQKIQLFYYNEIKRYWTILKTFYNIFSQFRRTVHSTGQAPKHYVIIITSSIPYRRRDSLIFQFVNSK